MYYSSESSDSDNVHDRKSLDLSYLMLDSDSLASYLKNSVQEQRSTKSQADFEGHQDRSAATSTSTSSKFTNFELSPDSLDKVSPSAQDDSWQEEKLKLEHKMETLSTEAIGQLLIDEKKEKSLTLSTSYKAVQLKSLQLTITKSGRSSESDDVDKQGIPPKDDVTEKLFLNHNLIISVPFEIVLFHKLKFLDLSSNNISHLNDYLLHLPELQTLYLKNNQLDNDSLPKDFSVLRKIREINLSGNVLTVVPPQLFEVTSLCYLYLGNNAISEVRPEIKSLQNLQVLHLGGNSLISVPDELGDLHSLCALVLSNNKLRRLPRAISSLTKLRSLLLHNNNICCLPVEIVKLRGLSELSLRDNPLVTRFVNTCARSLLLTPPSLKELSARTVRQHKVEYETADLPVHLNQYLNSGHKCVNPRCKGVYFTSCVEHIKLVDFCGMYRVPLMHYLCSARCTSQTPSYYGSSNSSDSDDDPMPDNTMRRVLLG